MSDAMMVMNNHSNNMNDEWYTPQEYIEAARRVMGQIDLDPASNQEANNRIQAARFFSKEDTALDKEWHGKVWMNPPYSRIIKEFTSKLVHEYVHGNVTEAIVVTNNGTDTRWFHEMAEMASAVCFHKGRIGFINQAGDRVDNNNKGQIFTYIGNRPERFAQEFKEFGIIAMLD